MVLTDKYLGDGLLVYTIVQYMKAKTCVVLGSGGGFIPRIISQGFVLTFMIWKSLKDTAWSGEIVEQQS